MRLPSPELLWERHEALVLKVFTIALSELQKQVNLPEDEPTLNEQLFIHIRVAYLDLPYKQRPQSLVIRNSEIPPRSMNEVGEPWTKKKPDFQWVLINNHERDSEKAIKEYTIECKRLTNKTSRDFINEYVNKGIVRFLAKEHKYGNGTTSGAMIGYIQDTKQDEALEGVNSVITNIKEFVIPKIQLDKNSLIIGKISNGSHTLNRAEVYPSIFNLRHIWIQMPYR